jgi:DNA topoisomerase-1
MTISEAEARKLIAEKEETERKRIIADFGKIKVLNGPYGPYVTDGKANAKIPKEIKPKSLDEAASLKLLAEAPKTRGRRFQKRPAKTS